MEFGFNEAAHEEIGVALKSEKVKLDGVHQAVKQSALGNPFVEDDDVKKSEGVHMSDIGEIRETQGSGFFVKGRIGNTGSVEFDDFHALEQSRRKIGPHERFVVPRERRGGREVAFALLAEEGRNQIDGFE